MWGGLCWPDASVIFGIPSWFHTSLLRSRNGHITQSFNSLAAKTINFGGESSPVGEVLIGYLSPRRNYSTHSVATYKKQKNSHIL